MLHSVRVIALVSIAFVVASCSYFSKSDRADAIAVAYGKYLYRSDIVGVVPPGSSADDSTEIVRQFIDNWVRRQVILNQAENNLTDEQMDFSSQLETYRNSLIVYSYESELIRQALDTSISQQEIERFYQENPQNFQLRENILRVNFVKVPVSSAKPELVAKAARLLKSDKSGDLDELDELCQKSLLLCSIENEKWLTFSEMQRDIPVMTDDETTFLQSRTFFETRDSLYVYLVRITDYKTRESVSPLSLETENIRSVILNRRKLELISKMEQEVFQKALENKDFQIF